VRSNGPKVIAIMIHLAYDPRWFERPVELSGAGSLQSRPAVADLDDLVRFWKRKVFEFGF
jgi:hypothetical protein